MKSVFFPGKFQPPHIGHVMTIGKLIKKYGYVIVGITEGKPRIVSRTYVKNVFESIFKDGEIECILLKGTLTDYDKLPEMSKFDLMMSGNEEVLQWGLKLGIPIKKMPRSEGIFCSGTEIRNVLK